MNQTKILLILLTSLLTMNALAVKPVLQFRNQSFKIVQFTDLHLIGGTEFALKNDSTYRLMRFIIREENPDLVVLTGDIVVSAGAKAIWEQVVEPMSDAKVPFAITFGNHDTESDMSKSEILHFIQNNKYNLTYNADQSLSGVGNCSLPILSTNGNSTPWTMYLFDSHSYPKDTTMGVYDWIKNDQIQWYRKQSAAYARKEGKPVSALAFFHIPFPEFEQVRKQKSVLGSTAEPVCSPAINSGLFASFVEKGDVLGVFVGHDHNNDFIGELSRIFLGYGRKTGYASAYHEILERGARIIILHENERNFDTYIRTLSGKYLNSEYD